MSQWCECQATGKKFQNGCLCKTLALLTRILSVKQARGVRRSFNGCWRGGNKMRLRAPGCMLPAFCCPVRVTLEYSEFSQASSRSICMHRLFCGTKFACLRAGLRRGMSARRIRSKRPTRPYHNGVTRCQVASRIIGFRYIIVHVDIIDPPYTIPISIILESGKRVACADLSSGSVVDSRTNLGSASR